MTTSRCPVTSRSCSALRLSARPPAVRRLLLALALDGDLRADDLHRLSGEDVLTEAVESGLVVVERDRVDPPTRCSPPQPGRWPPSWRSTRCTWSWPTCWATSSSARSTSPWVPGPGRRQVRDRVGGGRSGRRRGATREAAVLAGHALRLTPRTAAQWPERVLDLADRLRVVGDKTEMTTLVTDSLDPSWTPAQRVRGHLLLTSGDIEHSDDVRQHLDPPRLTRKKPRVHGPRPRSSSAPPARRSTSTSTAASRCSSTGTARAARRHLVLDPRGADLGGRGLGLQFIPRIGMEVVVEFLEGDPDRPLVTGCVYNGDNAPPYPLPGREDQEHASRPTRSPGGGGFNELRFEDAAGSEEIYLHAQKDCNDRVENDKTQTVGDDETLSVGNDRTKTSHDRRDDHHRQRSDDHRRPRSCRDDRQRLEAHRHRQPNRHDRQQPDRDHRQQPHRDDRRTRPRPSRSTR